MRRRLWMKYLVNCKYIILNIVSTSYDSGAYENLDEKVSKSLKVIYDEIKKGFLKTR